MRGLAAAMAFSLLLPGTFLAMDAHALEGDGSMTTYDWSSRKHLGDTAVALTVTLLDDGDCTFTSYMGGSQNPRGGPMLFEQILRDDGEVFGSLVFSSYKSHQVHAGPVDTRGEIDIAGEATLFPTGTFGSEVSTEGPFEAGTYTFSMGGLDLQSTTSDPTRLGYHALRASIECEQSFTVDRVQAGHELLLVNAENMEGGAGAFESLVASAQVDVGVSEDLASAEVHSWISWREYQDPAVLVGELTRTTPEGTTVHDLTATGQTTIRDVTGPGTHRLELDRVALDFFSSFHGVVYGLDDVSELDAFLPR